MKKLILFAFLLVLAFAVVLATLQAPGRGVDVAATKICLNVGWNTRICTANASVEVVQPVAAVFQPPVYTPNVGWNT
jgi:hypothetical protein